jgi:hypothetical protein
MLDGSEVRRRKSGKDMGDCENMAGIVMSVIVVCFGVFATDENHDGGTRSGRAI